MQGRKAKRVSLFILRLPTYLVHKQKGTLLKGHFRKGSGSSTPKILLPSPAPTCSLNDSDSIAVTCIREKKIYPAKPEPRQSAITALLALFASLAFRLS